MKKPLSIVLVVLASALWAPASALAVANGSITGTITDASSGLPIEGAEACAYGEGAPSCAVSNGSGAYQITELAPGSYKVWFSDSAGGYLEQYFDHTTEWWGAEPVAVTSGNAIPGIDAALERPGSISGTVTDAETGEPVAGINVCAEALSGYSYDCETSGADGTYTIGGLRQGSYEVSFRSGWIETGPGEYEPVSYVRQYYDGEATEVEADSVSVDAGTTTPGIDAAMIPGAEVEGTVTDGTAAVDNAEVCAYQAASGKEASCAHTDEEGNYLIVGIPAGNYKIGFFPPFESVLAPQYYDGKSSLKAADSIPLGPAAKTTGIDATLVEAGKIAGTVTKAAGGAIQGISVCAYREEGGSKCTSTDSAGKYTLVGLVAGKWIVWFGGSSEYVTQYYSGAARASEATHLTVENGVTQGGIDAQLSPAGRIEGRVTGADTGEAISNTQVCAAPTSASSYFPEGVCAFTDAEGHYTIGGLAPRSYDVRFDASYSGGAPLNYLVQYYKDAETRSHAAPVSVTAGGAANGIDAALRPGGQISGTVTDAVTQAGVKAEVCALPSLTHGGTQSCVYSNSSDGTYLIQGLRTDNYKVRFSPWASTVGYVRQYFAGKTTKKEANPVAVTAGAAPVTGVDAEMHKGGTIAGTVTDAGTHIPLEGIEVCAGGYCDTTASDGSYEVLGLKSGEYRVQFSGRQGTAKYATVYYHDEPSREEAQKVTVANGSKTAGIDQEMHEGGRITGTVLDDTTEARLENIEVCASDPDTFAYQCDLTDEQGEYEIVGLSPGSYRVHFYPQSWGPPAANAAYAPQYYADVETAAAATRVAVGLGDVVSEIDAAMHQGGRIEGSVAAAAGHAPVAGVYVCAFPIGEESEEEGPENCAFTDSNGEYAIDGLLTGSYTVSFYPGMYSFEPTELLSQYYDGSTTSKGADPVSVTAGSTTPAIDAELFVGGRISGTITDADGSQLEGVEACAVEAGGEEESVRCASSNAHGAYTIMPLPAGSYKVRFSAFSFEWEEEFSEEEGPEPERKEEFVTQYWKGASSLGAADAISLSLGQNVGGINAQMVKTGTLPPPPPPSGGGGESSSGGAGQSSNLPQASPPPGPGPSPPQGVHCRKGFKKKRIHGKTRCVKLHKHKGKRHHRSR